MCSVYRYSLPHANVREKKTNTVPWMSFIPYSYILTLLISQLTNLRKIGKISGDFNPHLLKTCVQNVLVEVKYQIFNNIQNYDAKSASNVIYKNKGAGTKIQKCLVGYMYKYCKLILMLNVNNLSAISIMRVCNLIYKINLWVL